MNTDELRLDQVTESIIGCAFRVMNTLGSGFLEKVYENALAYEIRESGLTVSRQHGIIIMYNNVAVGEYAVDLLIEGTSIVELKAVKSLDKVPIAQCVSFLKLIGLHLCLLLNLGRPRLEIRQIVNGI